MKNYININLNIAITDEDIDDIMSAALEGGITYWCDDCTVEGEYLGEFASEQISNDGSLILHDSEEDNDYVLTKEKFLNGVRLACLDYLSEGKCDWIDEQNVLPSEIDACVADVIVQYALFQEIVFG